MANDKQRNGTGWQMEDPIAIRKVSNGYVVVPVMRENYPVPMDEMIVHNSIEQLLSWVKTWFSRTMEIQGGLSKEEVIKSLEQEIAARDKMIGTLRVNLEVARDKVSALQNQLDRGAIKPVAEVEKRGVTMSFAFDAAAKFIRGYEYEFSTEAESNAVAGVVRELAESLNEMAKEAKES